MSRNLLIEEGSGRERTRTEGTMCENALMYIGLLNRVKLRI